MVGMDFDFVVEPEEKGSTASRRSNGRSSVVPVPRVGNPEDSKKGVVMNRRQKILKMAISPDFKCTQL